MLTARPLMTERTSWLSVGRSDRLSRWSASHQNTQCEASFPTKQLFLSSCLELLPSGSSVVNSLLKSPKAIS